VSSARSGEPSNTSPVRAVLGVALAVVAIAGTAMTGHGVSGKDGTPDVPRRSTGQATDRGVAAAGMRVISPDVMVVSASPLSNAVVSVIGADRRVTHSITLDGGQAQVGGMRMNTLGVRLATFRRWAPPAVAASGRIWRTLARGGVSVAATFARSAGVTPGGTYLVGGQSAGVAAVATVHDIGVPNVGALVSERIGERLGLLRDVAALIDVSPEQTVALVGRLRDTLPTDARVVRLRDLDNAVPVTVTSNYQRPRSYVDLYRQSAAYCPGLPWSVLAAIGEVESAHGRYNGPSSAGALGPMQFMPSTWQDYGFDGNGDGRHDIMNPFDAVPAAAKYLCGYGGGSGGQALYEAIFAYNHADWYVRKVLRVARYYRHTYGD